MTRTIKCVQCDQHKEQDRFGKKQLKLTNPSPTCLECAEKSRVAEWAAQFDHPGHGSGPLLTCRFCGELKGESDYTKKMWKRHDGSKPVCVQCKHLQDTLEWGLGEITHEDMLLRCHATQELDILLQYAFLSWQDVTTFLAKHSDEEYAQLQGFSPGPAHDGKYYSANEWLVNYAGNSPSDEWVKSLVANIASRLNLAPALELWILTAAA